MNKVFDKLILVKDNNSFRQVGVWSDINKVTKTKDGDLNISIHGALIQKEYLFSKIRIEADYNKLGRIRINEPLGPLFFTNRGKISETVYELMDLEQGKMFDLESDFNINSLILNIYSPKYYQCKLLYCKINDIRKEVLLDLSQIKIDQEAEDQFVPSIQETNSVYNSLT